MVHELKPGRKPIKEMFVRLMFFLFGRALQTVSRLDETVQQEVAEWPEGFMVLHRVLPDGPRMAIVRNRKGRLEYKGGKPGEEEADLVISIKNLESIFLIVSLQIGMFQAFAENRVAVKGNVPVALSMTRCLNILVTYLVPRRTVQPLVRRAPEIPAVRKHVCRFFILFIGIPFGF